MQLISECLHSCRNSSSACSCEGEWCVRPTSSPHSPRRLGPMAGWGDGHSRLRRLTGMF